MRARNIKPGFFKNAELANLPLAAQILFIGMWCMADREGRLWYRPEQIKAEVLPYRRVSVALLCVELEKAGFIRRYGVADGREAVQIVNFRKHQNPHVKEAQSTIPAPDSHRTRTGLAPDEHGTSPADSLIPDSLIPDSKNPPTPLSVEKPEKAASQNRAGLKFESQNLTKSNGNLDAVVMEIAKLYPKVLDPQHLPHDVEVAIVEAVARDGRDLVFAGTKSMAEVVRKWDKAEFNFIPGAAKFFHESQYRRDPKTWSRDVVKRETTGAVHDTRADLSKYTSSRDEKK